MCGDVDINTKTVRQAKKTIHTNFETLTKNMELNINNSKTKFMVVRNNRETLGKTLL